jgi:hypothetical protein
MPSSSKLQRKVVDANVRLDDPEEQSIAASAGASVHITINDLPLDVLVLIFQKLFDETAAKKMHQFWGDSSVKAPHICAQLARVNKHWKETVYNSPSLWSIFSFDMRKT